MIIVIDASVAVDVVRRTSDASKLEGRLYAATAPFHAPAVIDLEVAHALCAVERRGQLSRAGTEAAFTAFRTFALARHGHATLLDRIWELRHNVTAYDASYVALAEVLGATLLTRDARLAAAPGVRARVEVI